jgi:hypothetical protein
MCCSGAVYIRRRLNLVFGSKLFRGDCSKAVYMQGPLEFIVGSGLYYGTATCRGDVLSDNRTRFVCCSGGSLYSEADYSEATVQRWAEAYLIYSWKRLVLREGYL